MKKVHVSVHAQYTLKKCGWKCLLGNVLEKYLKVSNKFNLVSTIQERNCYHYRISQTCEKHR